MLTEPGSTVGTVAYMSPEQLRGEDLDERPESFSLGLVLYEMATGRQAFAGATSAVISAAILHATPLTPRTIRPDLPQGSRRHSQGHRKGSSPALAARVGHSSRSPAVEGGHESRSRRQPRHLHIPPVERGQGSLLLPCSSWPRAVFFYRQRTSARPLTDKDVLVIADFTNTTGDPVFDETLRQGLAVQLGQSPFLSVAADDRIRRALQQMGQSPHRADLTDEVARDICVRTGSTAVVNGSIASLGSDTSSGSAP